nr:hypothetical protein GCM10017745_17530 [Saccharothrix mutabilis subsp. capreolus]
MTNPSTVPAAAPRGWRSMLPSRSPKLLVGFGLIAVITLFGVLGPLFAGDPTTIRDLGLTPPGGDFPLGTTLTGQDVLAQLAHATGARSTSACWSG